MSRCIGELEEVFKESAQLGACRIGSGDAVSVRAQSLLNGDEMRLRTQSLPESARERSLSRQK